LVGVPLLVEIPPPWEMTWLHDNGTEAAFSSGAGDFVYIAAGNVQDPARGAAAYVPEILDRYLPPEFYTQREFGEVLVQQPFGSLGSVASIPYRALWVDSQSSFPVRGNLWMVIRHDGKAVVLTAESTPEDHFADEAWRAIIDPTVNEFANPDV
jgi:hypothetical protein